jgi:hypothetical protein
MDGNQIGQELMVVKIHVEKCRVHGIYYYLC